MYAIVDDRQLNKRIDNFWWENANMIGDNCWQDILLRVAMREIMRDGALAKANDDITHNPMFAIIILFLASYNILILTLNYYFVCFFRIYPPSYHLSNCYENPWNN